MLKILPSEYYCLVETFYCQSGKVFTIFTSLMEGKERKRKKEDGKAGRKKRRKKDGKAGRKKRIKKDGKAGRKEGRKEERKE